MNILLLPPNPLVLLGVFGFVFIVIMACLLLAGLDQ